MSISEWDMIRRIHVSGEKRQDGFLTECWDLTLTDLGTRSSAGESPENHHKVIDSIQRLAPVLNLLREGVEGEITVCQLLQILDREGGPLFSYFVEHGVDSREEGGKGNLGRGCLLPILLKTVCTHAFGPACQRLIEKGGEETWLGLMMDGAKALLEGMDPGDRTRFLSSMEYNGVKLVGQALKGEIQSRRLDAEKALERARTFCSLIHFMPTFSHMISFLEECILPLYGQAKEWEGSFDQMFLEQTQESLSRRADWEKQGIKIRIMCGTTGNMGSCDVETTQCAIEVGTSWRVKVQLIEDQVQQQLDSALNKGKRAKEFARENWKAKVTKILKARGMEGAALASYRQVWADSVKAGWASREATEVGAEASPGGADLSSMLEKLCKLGPDINLTNLTQWMKENSEGLKRLERTWELAEKKLKELKGEKKGWEREKADRAKLKNMSLFDTGGGVDFCISCDTRFNTQFVLNVLKEASGEIPLEVKKSLERSASSALTQRGEMDGESFHFHMDQVTQALSVFEDEGSVHSLCDSAILCLASHLHHARAVGRFCDFMTSVFDPYLSNRWGQQIRVTEMLCRGGEEVEPLFMERCFSQLSQEVREKVILGAMLSKRSSRQLNPSSGGYFVLRLIIHCYVLGSPPLLGSREWLKKWMVEVDFSLLGSGGAQERDVQALIDILVKDLHLFYQMNAGCQTAILEAIHSRVTEEKVPYSDQTTAQEVDGLNVHRVLRPGWEGNRPLCKLCQSFPWGRMSSLSEDAQFLIDLVNLQEIEKKKDLIGSYLRTSLLLHTTEKKVECMTKEEVDQALSKYEDYSSDAFVQDIYNFKKSPSQGGRGKGVEEQFQKVRGCIEHFLPMLELCQAWDSKEDICLKPSGHLLEHPAAAQSVDQSKREKREEGKDFSSGKDGEVVSLHPLSDFFNYCEGFHPCLIEAVLLEKKEGELNQGCVLPVLMREICTRALVGCLLGWYIRGGGPSVDGGSISRRVLSEERFDQLIKGITYVLLSIDEQDGQIFSRTTESAIVNNLCEIFKEDLKSGLLDKAEAMRRLRAVFRLTHVMPNIVEMDRFLQVRVPDLFDAFFSRTKPLKDGWDKSKGDIKQAFFDEVDQAPPKVTVQIKAEEKRWINFQLDQCCFWNKQSFVYESLSLPCKENDLNELISAAEEKVQKQFEDVLEEKRQTAQEKETQWNLRILAFLNGKVMEAPKPKKGRGVKKEQGSGKGEGDFEKQEKRVRVFLDAAAKVAKTQFVVDEKRGAYKLLFEQKEEGTEDALYQLQMAENQLKTAQKELKSKGSLPQWMKEWEKLPHEKEWKVAMMELNSLQRVVGDHKKRSKAVRDAFQKTPGQGIYVFCRSQFEKQFLFALLDEVKGWQTFFPLSGIEQLEMSLVEGLKTEVDKGASEEGFETCMGWICRGLSRFASVDASEEVCRLAIRYLAHNCDHPKAPKWFFHFMRLVFDFSLSGYHKSRLDVIDILCSGEGYAEPLFRESFFSHLSPYIRRKVAAYTSLYKLDSSPSGSDLVLRLIIHCCSSCPDVGILKPLKITWLDFSSLGPDAIQESLEKIIKILYDDRERFHQMGFIEQAGLLGAVFPYLTEGKGGNHELLPCWKEDVNLRSFCQSFVGIDTGALTRMSRELITRVTSKVRDIEAECSHSDDPCTQSSM